MKELKLYSERNLLRMVTFYNEYRDYEISPLPVAKLESGTKSIPKLSVSELENKPKSITKPPVAKLENQSDFKQKLILSTKWKERSQW